jgi:hypothetical protein
LAAIIQTYQETNIWNKEIKMNKKNIVMGFIAVALVFAFGFAVFIPDAAVYASFDEKGRSPWGTTAGSQAGIQAAPGSGLVLSPLSDQEKTALQSAILEEYGAYNLYSAAIKQVGNVYPFSRIVSSEQQHINALVRQAQKYGVSVPANPGLTTVPSFPTLASACQAGVAAEIADAKLYDTLKPVTTHTDLLKVYNNLQSASLNSHLPAFQTCD